ncbi:MAG: DUF3352 domain-containing protein [bacterium]
MKKSITSLRLIQLLLALALSAVPLAAQQKHGVAPRKPAPAPVTESIPTFDTLLADDSYKVYFEVRGVGQLIRSSAVNDLLDPVLKIGGPRKEFKATLKWLEAQADSIAGSRMLVASWPTNTNLPAVLMAIEFSSPEEARKFEPELRRFMPTLAPTPAPTPVVASVDQGRNNLTVKPQTDRASLPYHITHAGSLVLLSDKAFAFRDLKPRRAKLLAEDPNFVTARSRFASESLFLYVDVKAIEKEDQERRKRWEEEERRAEEEAAKRPKPEPTPEIEEPTTVAATSVPTPEEPPAPAVNATATLGTSGQTATSGTLTGQDTTAGRDSQFMNMLTRSFYSALFGGQTKWPEAVAAAVAFEGDAYVVRALILSGAESKSLAFPFFSPVISGPAVTPQAPAVLPADADLFISASLDYPHMYDGFLKTVAGISDGSRDYSRQTVNLSQPVSPFAEYEKKLGLKIKDDILPLLGNELALAMLAKNTIDNSTTSATSPTNGNQAKTNSPDPDPIIAIAVKDKEAVRRLIPKMIDALTFKGADLLAQTERKDDTEITTYANLLAYAFVGDFLILSPNPTATKRAVAAYLNGETLAANNHFRNASRWQSRQMLAQVYLDPALVQKYSSVNLTNPVNEKMAELMSRLGPLEPLTYSLSNEGSGPLHELHIPRNLLLLMVASISNDASAAPLNANEAAAKSVLRTLVSAEATFQATTGDGRYGTLDELATAGMISKEPIDRYGYKIDLIVSGSKFEVSAVPLEYGKTGRLSYFVDESAMVRGGDHGGGPATISDPPIQ